MSNSTTWPTNLPITRDPDVLHGFSQDAISQKMPPALARPKTTSDISKILSFAHSQHIPVTPCAGQTSLTGSSVTDQGLLLSTASLEKSLQIYEDPKRAGKYIAEVSPSYYLGQLQEMLIQRGYFYPPDPTSRFEAMLGGTLATNASGENSFRYGSTRRWVRGLEIVHADGRVKTYWRPPNKEGNPSKNTCGIPFREDPVDWFIGTEGALGIISKAYLEILPNPPEHLALLIFFEEEGEALTAVQRWVAKSWDMTCLEFMDLPALEIARKNGLSLPHKCEACLYVKLEHDSPEVLEVWFENLSQDLSEQNMEHLLDHIKVFEGRELEQLRQWRHAIPATINERAASYKKNGGGKVGTDWYVPLPHLMEMFQFARLDQSDLEWYVFGHIGNGHPHFNFVARNAKEYNQARQFLVEHCKKAVALGGGISGEHGLGKLKRHMLNIQYKASEIEEMKKIKRQCDPDGILAPGNLFQ